MGKGERGKWDDAEKSKLGKQTRLRVASARLESKVRSPKSKVGEWEGRKAEDRKRRDGDDGRGLAQVAKCERGVGRRMNDE